MRRAVGMLVVLAVLAAGCGSEASDAVDGAENCTELAQAWSDGDQTDQGFRDKVVARLADLKSDARARGSDTEAVTCGLFLSEAGAEDSEEFFMEGDS